MFQPDSIPPLGAQALEAVRCFPNAQDAAALSSEERAAWLYTLQQVMDATAAAYTEVLASFDTYGDGETLHGARSTAAWLRGAQRLSPGEASRRVRQARASKHHLAHAVQLMREGQVTAEQVSIISKAVCDLPEQHREQATTVLTDLAQQAGAAEVATCGRRLQEVVNPDGSVAVAEKDYSRRHLYLSPLLDGMVSIDGVLDPEGGAIVQAMLEPFLVPTDATDDRDTAQRRADGLVAVAQLAMSQGQLPISGGSKPQLNVLTTIEALTGMPGVGGSTLTTTGAVVGPEATVRIACDSTVARILLDPVGVPVALGRAQRLFTPQQRKLLALRDGGCRFPGCHMPPAFTDAHHLVPWTNDGETNLDNGLLICRFHHRRLHEGKWSVEAGDRLRGANGLLTFTGPLFQKLESKPCNYSLTTMPTLTWWTQPPDRVPRT